MKFEDIKEGMQVRDHLGNEYEVIQVEEKRDSFPVQLHCTKLVQSAKVDADIEFDTVGAIWWIADNRKYLLNASDSTVQQILRGLGANPEYAHAVTIQMDTLAGEPQTSTCTLNQGLQRLN